MTKTETDVANVTQHDRVPQAIQETLKICKEKNLLSDYFEKNEAEVTEILLNQFARRSAMEQYAKYMRKKGYTEGYLSMVRENLVSKETAADKLGISAAGLERKLVTQDDEEDITDIYLSLLAAGLTTSEIAAEKIGISVEEVERKLSVCG